jgi:hypothetical protein
MLSKVFSGRYLLTIVCGIVFYWSSITGQLSNEAVAAVIMMVFTAYFNRNDRDSKEQK